MNISFLDLNKINLEYQKTFQEKLQEFLERGFFINGENVKHFENEYADFCGAKYAIGISNGLDALRMVLEGFIHLGYAKPGDEILIPSNTYIATCLAVSQAGLKPIFVEPNDKFLIDTSLIEKHITSKTKGIIPVHLYGQLCDIQSLLTLKEKYNIFILDDCAQSHGAFISSSSQRCGSYFDASAFSFYPGKNLGALGDAGAITTNNEELFEFCKTSRNYGSSEKYVNILKGYNNRLDELQAIFLREKLKNLDRDNSRRSQIARYYNDNIKNEKLVVPILPNQESSHVWHIYNVLTEKRQNFQNYLSSKSIQTLIHYPIPIHKQEAYLELKELELPKAENYAQTCLSLPMSPILTDIEVEYIVDVINRF